VFAASPFDAFVEKRGSARRRGTFGMIVHEMGRLIVEGVYAAGTTLPREDELIAKLNVSRTPFREAMKTLAAKGLVEIRPKTGTRVRERSDWHHTDPDVMVWHYEAGSSKEFLDSLADLRRVLEPAAAARAAERATKADVARIAKAYRGMYDTIDDPKGHSEADRDFHTAIFLATHNLMLSQMIDLIVVGIYANAVMASAAVVEGQRQSLPYHAAVLAAIEAKDPIAATAVTNRLLDSWHPAPERVRLAKQREKALARSGNKAEAKCQ
jgi:GntR family transcriptional regulator, galactonate operon transcriptional repressor